MEEVGGIHAEPAQHGLPQRVLGVVERQPQFGQSEHRARGLGSRNLVPAPVPNHSARVEAGACQAGRIG